SWPIARPKLSTLPLLRGGAVRGCSSNQEGRRYGRQQKGLSMNGDVYRAHAALLYAMRVAARTVATPIPQRGVWTPNHSFDSREGVLRLRGRASGRTH